MALTVTYRGHVDSPPGTGNTAVSGPIPCATGDALVIVVGADSDYENTNAATVTLSTGWGINYVHTNTFMGNVSDGALTGIYAAIPIPANGSPIITVVTNGTAGWRRPSFDIYTVTGYDPAQPQQDWGYQDTYGRPVTNYTLHSSPFPSPGNTIAIIGGTDCMKRPLPTGIAGDGILSSNTWDQPVDAGNPRGVSGYSIVAKWVTPDTNQSYTIYPTHTFSVFPVVYMEFRPAPEVPAVYAGDDTTIERLQSITHISAEDPKGNPITAREWRQFPFPVSGGGTVVGTAQSVVLPSATAGPYVLRYKATNAVGASAANDLSDMKVTVTPLRPRVGAGPDVTIGGGGGAFTRTASEIPGDVGAILQREWKITTGPSGVGSVVGTAALLSWTPPTLGQWTFQYRARDATGWSDPDAFTLSVGVAGMALPGIRRTPAPLFAVAAAFGGDLTDPDGSDWVFTEITSDVRIEQGVHLRHGRADEAGGAQPAACAFTLDNRTGKYSLGGRSPYWPNIRQGTPIQISASLTGGPPFKVIFTGYADGFTPSWSTVPLSGTSRGDATVTVSASGVMRRLAQGQPPVISPIRRGLTGTPGVVAYWPCEDAQDARQLASAIPTHPPMDYSGRLHAGGNPDLPPAVPRLAEAEGFWCSQPLPLVSDSEWYGAVPDYTGTEIIQLRCLIEMPSAGSINGTVILGLITTGDPQFWELRYMTGGLINVRAWRNFTTLVLDTPPIALCLAPGAVLPTVGIDGRRGQLGLTLTKSGANVDWVVDFIEQGAGIGYVYGPGAGGAVVPGASVGKALRVQTCTDGGHFDVALGHIVVRKDLRDGAEHVRHLNAWSGDEVGARIKRLSDEQGMPWTMHDGDVPRASVSDIMGPQSVGTVLELLGDCEATDQGLLWDGVTPGITYTTKRYRESRAPALTLDAAAGDLGIPFVPAHDDAYRCNRAEVKRHAGSSAAFTDTTGPLGSNIIGRYDNSFGVGVQSDAALVQYAAWAVFQGTAEGYRYPRLTLNLTARPGLLDEWLALLPGDRVDVEHVHAVNAAAPEESIALAVEGYEQTITPHLWVATLNTSLYRRWSVAQVCANANGGAGDPREEFAARVDTNGSTIAELTPAGQTTLKVAVSAGPAWVTSAARPADFPLSLDVGGIAVRATACAAPSGGTQTFTIDPMPVTRPAGTPVQVWQPAVYAL